jgi:hypothetical protein
LKEGDGIELIKRIKLLDPEARMLVYSMHGSCGPERRAMSASSSRCGPFCRRFAAFWTGRCTSAWN